MTYHTLTARKFSAYHRDGHPDHRRQAKVVNFGIVYGLSALACRSNLGIEPERPKIY